MSTTKKTGLCRGQHSGLEWQLLTSHLAAWVRVTGPLLPQSQPQPHIHARNSIVSWLCVGEQKTSDKTSNDLYVISWRLNGESITAGLFIHCLCNFLPTPSLTADTVTAECSLIHRYLYICPVSMPPIPTPPLTHWLCPYIRPCFIPWATMRDSHWSVSRKTTRSCDHAEDNDGSNGWKHRHAKLYTLPYIAYILFFSP